MWGISSSTSTYPNASNFWFQHSLDIRYSYVITLTNKLPIYLKCTPQNDGSAVMADIVQALPSTKDGYIYIFLGVAYSTMHMELLMYHPVYYHDGTGIRLWTGAESGGGGGMLVTFTTPDNGGTYTADKTFGEIFAAFDSGIQPVFKFISSSTTTYTTIKDASTSGSSTPYGILFSTFYATRLWGTANDYPSWSSDN